VQTINPVRTHTINDHSKANNYDIMNMSNKHDYDIYLNTKTSINTMTKPIPAFISSEVELLQKSCQNLGKIMATPEKAKQLTFTPGVETRSEFLEDDE
jgi:hypothetical protein